MTNDTLLDRAQARMGQSDADRLQFFAALADAELHLLLTEEPKGEDLSPRLFPVEGGQVVLAFDSQERLAEFAKEVAPYVALPGRILAQVLAEQGLGLGLNLDVAPSSMILPADAMVWLTEMLDAQGPDAGEAQLSAVRGPGKVPEILLEALGARLTSSAGLAAYAVLAEADFAAGGTGHVLAIVGAQARAEPALAQAVSEAVTFSGIDAGHLDVAFVSETHPLTARIGKVGMRFDIPQPEKPQSLQPVAPGSNPDKPPRLR